LWNIPQLQRFIKRLPTPNKLQIGNVNFNFCTIGGTFDRLHIGHKTLINVALIFSKRVLVCVTSDQYAKSLRKIAAELIEPYDLRKKRVEEFISSLGKSNATYMYKLEDPYSPATTSEFAVDIDSIVISNEPAVTERTFKLNELRLEYGLSPLKILRIPLLRDPYGEIISSTRYRLNDFFPPPRPPELRLTNEVTKKIREPKGAAITSPKYLPDYQLFKKSGVIAIGDAAFVNLLRFGYPVSVALVDFKIQRKGVSYATFYCINEETKLIDVPPMIPVINPPGRISTESWYATLIAFVQENPTIVTVYGEEDLLGFPATMLAPEGSLVVYGDPFKKKLIYFIVDSDHKENALDLLLKMQSVDVGNKQ